MALRTVKEADRILAAAQKCKEAIILGGGLVSLQAAQALWKRGLAVTVIVGSPHVLSRNLDEKAALVVEEAMARCGITLQLGIKQDPDLRQDAVMVCGKGVKPNLLSGPLCTGEKMKVDASMRTCLENVYAAGDVSLGRHVISGQWDRVANWPNACVQGWTAGLNMAGRPAQLNGLLNHNVSELFGVKVVSIGIIEPPFPKDYRVLTWWDEITRVYKKIVLHEDCLVGAVLINDVRDAGVIHKLVEKRVNLSSVLAKEPRGRCNLSGVLSSYYLPCWG